MPKQKIIRTGNSLGITIPAQFIKAIGIKAGQEVEVRTQPDQGKIIYSFSGVKQLRLSLKNDKA